VVTDVSTDSVGLTFKGQTSKKILPIEDIITTFYRKVRETISQWLGVLNTRLVVSRTRWAKTVARMTDRK